jgi:hypothetical protein
LLTYPAWFSALDRQRIDEVITSTSALMISPPQTSSLVIVIASFWRSA